MKSKFNSDMTTDDAWDTTCDAWDQLCDKLANGSLSPDKKPAKALPK
jgi:hypothetical protein